MVGEVWHATGTAAGRRCLGLLVRLSFVGCLQDSRCQEKNAVSWISRLAYRRTRQVNTVELAQYFSKLANAFIMFDENLSVTCMCKLIVPHVITYSSVVCLCVGYSDISCAQTDKLIVSRFRRADSNRPNETGAHIFPT